jgi:hypothetical protein
MTAQVLSLKTPTANALIDQVKAAWDRADEKKADADDWYIRTGKLLLELKQRTGHGQWLPTLKKLGRSQRRAHELMELAEDPKALETSAMALICPNLSSLPTTRGRPRRTSGRTASLTCAVTFWRCSPTGTSTSRAGSISNVRRTSRRWRGRPRRN